MLALLKQFDRMYLLTNATGEKKMKDLIANMKKEQKELIDRQFNAVIDEISEIRFKLEDARDRNAPEATLNAFGKQIETLKDFKEELRAQSYSL